MQAAHGRVVVVTGAAQGIGAAIAERFAADGASVVIADLQADVAARTAERLAAEHATPVRAITLDVADSAAVTAAAAHVAAEVGPADVLVNCAGITNSIATFEHSDADWDRTMGINLNGPFYCSREFGRQMRGRGGSIVNVASVAGVRAMRPEFHLAYDVSKAGIIHFTTSLAAEWAPEGIRVNAVAPGYTNTPILEEVGRSDPGILERWLDRIPQHRLIDPAEIAAGVAFLASDQASAVTGHTLPVDCGYLAW